MKAKAKTEALETMRFQNWHDLIAFVETPLTDEALSSNAHASEGFAKDLKACRWNGFATLADSIELCKTGWLDKLDLVEAKSRPIRDRLSSRIEQINVYHDVEGAQIDVARYLDGEPECWQAFEVREVDGRGNRILKLAVDITASGAIEADKIVAQGARIVTLIECLELAGFRVEVTMLLQIAYYNSSTRDRNSLALDCRAIVKESDQPIDLGRLMFVIAHPACLRQIGFALEDTLKPATKNQIGSGRGQVSSASLASEYDIYIDGKHSDDSQWSTDESMIAYLTQTLKAQGVTLND